MKSDELMSLESASVAAKDYKYEDENSLELCSSPLLPSD